MKDNYKFIIGLLLFWIVLSERLNLETLLLGLVICLSITYINRYNNKHIAKRTCNYTKKIYCYFLYALVLMKGIVVSNVQVAMIVLSKDMYISPSTFEYKTKLSKDKYRTIFANSITLTPGTITVSMDNDKITVHCIKDEYINSIMNSKLEKILLKIEG